MEDTTTTVLFESIMQRAQGDLSAVIKLADRDSNFMAECLNPKLGTIWDHFWSQMNCRPSVSDAQKMNVTYIPLKAQKKIPGYLLFSGIQLYYQGNASGQEALLRKAANETYNNIHAMRDCVALDLHKLNQPDADVEGIVKRLLDYYGKRACDKHLAAGYLLLTQIHVELGKYFAEHDQGRSLSSYKLAYLNALIVDKLSDFSDAEIHNAFYGQSNGTQELKELKKAIPKQARLDAYLEQARCCVSNIIDENNSAITNQQQVQFFI